MPVKKVDRSDIVKEALKLFRVQGYHKTTMANIGDACGLLKGSIYHYFSSKEDLMRSVLEILRDHYRNKVFVFAYDEKINAEKRLKLLGEKCVDIFSNGEGACLMANIAMETNDVVPEFRKPIKEFFDDWTSALAHIYQERYSKKAAINFAKETICAVEGAAMMMRIYNDKNYLLKANQMILEKFERATKQALIS